MRALVRSMLLLTLVACNTPHAADATSTAAALLTRRHANHDLHASVAGGDCRVLVIQTETALDDRKVESIQYGIGDYAAFGGVERFAHDRGFRAVVYRDANDGLWTYGATTRDEARSMPRCR